MQEKFFVPLEIAKDLKKVGFSSSHISFYWHIIKGEEPIIVYVYDKLEYEDDWGSDGSTFVPAPTYHEVLNWLNEKGIEILIEFGKHMEKNKYEANVYVNPSVFKNKTDINWYDFNYKDLAKGNTKEEVLNKAIKKALTIC